MARDDPSDAYTRRNAGGWVRFPLALCGLAYHVQAAMCSNKGGRCCGRASGRDQALGTTSWLPF